MNLLAIWLEIGYSSRKSSCKEATIVPRRGNREETLNNSFAVFLLSADIPSCLVEPFTLFQREKI
jgi:hypothetical protein